jgi:hypothetical protein
MVFCLTNLVGLREYNKIICNCKKRAALKKWAAFLILYVKKNLTGSGKKEGDP